LATPGGDALKGDHEQAGIARDGWFDQLLA